MLKTIPEFICNEVIIPQNHKMIKGIVRISLFDKVTIKMAIGEEKDSEMVIATIPLMSFLTETTNTMDEAWDALKKWVNQHDEVKNKQIHYSDDLIETFEEEYWGAIYQNP